MNYPRVLQKVLCDPWCVRYETHAAIRRVLASRLKETETTLQAIAAEYGSGFVSDGSFPKEGPYNTVRADRSKLYVRGNLAVIPVHGVIGSHLSLLETMCGGYDVQYLQSAVHEAHNRADIKKVLFDFNSPGGAVIGVPEAAMMVRNLSKAKQTYSFTSGEMCSAAYWIASQTRRVYATASAIVGSIGVYIALLDETKAMELDGLKLELFKAGAHKGIGLPGNPLTDADRAILQSMVDSIYANFTKDIKTMRGGIDSNAMQGQVFFGSEAKRLGLIDATVLSANDFAQTLS
jgi:protease-4